MNDQGVELAVSFGVEVVYWQQVVTTVGEDRPLSVKSSRWHLKVPTGAQMPSRPSQLGKYQHAMRHPVFRSDWQGTRPGHFELLPPSTSAMKVLTLKPMRPMGNSQRPRLC